jgi:hypothetical protein
MPVPSLPFQLSLHRGPRPFGAMEALGVLGLLAAAVAVAFPHLPLLQAIWPPCAFRAVTGLPCGACGFTRAFVRLAHGEVAAALRVSPLGAALLAAWVAMALVVLTTWLLPSLPRPRIAARGRAGALLARWGWLALLVSNWAYLLAVTAITGAPPP